MYSAVVAAARLLLGYALLAPLVVGTLVATLLGTNIAASYWFQRQQRQRRQAGAFGPNTLHVRKLTVDPRVPQIPRLQFASHLPRAITSSLFPTDFNRSFSEPALELEQMGFPLVAAELLAVLKLVVRDFVQSWFGDITADTSFPRCVLMQIVQAVDAVAERMSGKVDAAQIVVGQVLPIVTAHIHAIKECEAAALEDTDAVGDNAKQRICDMYATSASIRWHPALHGMESGASAEERKRRVMAHVRKVVDLVVPLVLAPEQSSFAPHRVLVRELLTGALLGPVVMSIADPDTVNQLLDSQLERLIREQHMVNELRDALDQQARGDTPVPNVPDDGRMGRESNDSTLGPETNERPVVRTYEQFMTTIDECADVEELARIHEDVLAQIRKRRILIMGQNKDDIVHGQRVRDVLVYINRLYVAKKKAERRMEMLGRDQALSAGATARRRGSSGASGSFLQGLDMAAGPSSLMRGSVSSLPEPRTLHAPPPSTIERSGVSARRVLSGRTVSGGSDPLAAVPRRLRKSTVSRASTYYQHRDDPAKLGPPQFTLREILTNVTSLSAFTEYMDVIGCKFILEFWVNVEGVRQASKPREIFPSIVRTLWKNYFTLRVDELASVGGDEVEAAISRVQRVLKPFRVAGVLDLDTTKLDES
ncbi:tRNA (guanine-N(7)-)-methyltransferase (tRNA(m7G46)-methyltransferase), partial [Coemansia sp. RSA 2440]